MEYFRKITGAKTRWASFENPRGEKGAGGTANRGAKGRAFEPIQIGEIKTLLDTSGSGIIHRMWLTIPTSFHPLMDQLILRMYWDRESSPSVEVPLGAFFCAPLNQMRSFESALFSSPEGRSFNCFIPMPFMTGAKITLTNESSKVVSHLFYDINYELCMLDADKILYFHSYWNRETPELCKDYTILPKVEGCGRYMGQCLAVRANSDYGKMWFGEGEFKAYIDGDNALPTLCGTGIEDYIGTAWGQGEYSNFTQGCTIADTEKFEYTFYRFHTVDPIYFESDIRITVQSIGGGDRQDVLAALRHGANLVPVSRDAGGHFVGLFEDEFHLSENAEDGWYNFYRQDEYTSCAYFFLDRPGSIN